MVQEKNVKTVEYVNDADDELCGINRKTARVGKGYKYIHKNPLWLIAEFFVYRIIMKPFAYLYCKLRFSHKTVNREALKTCKEKGYFIYGNHTLYGGDAFIPNIISSPRKTFTIVHADNMSLFGTKNFLMMCGALPIPTDFHAKNEFMAAVEKRAVQHHAIAIYPEAHVWPYCTKIRPMHTAAFEYPVRFRDPVFCFTNTFSKKRFGKTPRVTTYIDGPFYPDEALSEREQMKKLADTVYAAMCERAKNNTYSPIRYVKRGGSND